MGSVYFKTLTFLLLLSIGQCKDGYNQIITDLLSEKANTGEFLNTIARWIWQNPDTIRGTISQILEAGLSSIPENVTSAVCVKHVELYLEALLRGEDWAVRMFDAVGKPSSALKDYSYTWLGDYEECIAVQAIQYEDPANKTLPNSFYRARYCMATLPVGMTALGPAAAQVGLCFPDTCSNSDVAGLIKTLVDSLNMTIPAAMIDCKERDVPLNDEAIVAIVVVLLFLAIMLSATLYDLMIQNINSKQKLGVEDRYTVGEEASSGQVEKDKLSNSDNPKVTNLQNGDVGASGGAQRTVYKPGVWGQVLLSFSVYTNAKKILNAQQSAGTLTSLNGIRFLSMSWVILGHTTSYGFNQIGNKATFFPALLKRFSFQAVSQGTFAVDTFFVLSGCLLAYLTLKEMKKQGGATKINWFMFYFHRFWRLTPPYMMFLMIYTLTFWFWGSGPFWYSSDFDKNICHKYWWTNLLYINNFIPAKLEEGCMAWTWYLADDMQFYVISPIWLISLFYSPIIGTIFCLVFIVGCIITNGIISNHFGFGPNIMFSPNQSDFLNKLYDKPWNKVALYVIGIWTGYMLYKTSCNVKLSKKVVFLGWTLSTGVALATVFGLYTETGFPDLSVELAAFYNAISRPAWACCVAWMMFACATGYGGPVNAILSWNGLIPLSRLTYFAYLVHPALLYLYFYSRKATIYMDDMGLVFLYLGVLCVTYGAAFVLSLAFESPMMALEKALLGQKKHS